MRVGHERAGLSCPFEGRMRTIDHRYRPCDGRYHVSIDSRNMLQLETASLRDGVDIPVTRWLPGDGRRRGQHPAEPRAIIW